MAIDRHRAGLLLLRLSVAVFFIFQGVNKLRWLTDTSVLAGQLAGWARSVPRDSISGRYLARVAIPYTAMFARLVPLGELSVGLALLAGFWTRMFAFVAFLMVLNYHIASGLIFQYRFLSNGYGLPVLGATLALALVGKGRSQKAKVKS